jgi:molybdopterin-guanine dinucleotide biosynthesis protein A
VNPEPLPSAAILAGGRAIRFGGHDKSALIFLTLVNGADRPDIIVPRTERGYHPLCAVYTRACLEPIARRLATGRLKVDALFDDVRVHVVTAETLAAFGDPDRLLANVNTPLEYRAIEADGIQS